MIKRRGGSRRRKETRRVERRGDALEQQEKEKKRIKGKNRGSERRMDRREEESGGEAERHGRLKHTFASEFNPIQLLCFRKVLILRGHFLRLHFGLYCINVFFKYLFTIMESSTPCLITGSSITMEFSQHLVFDTVSPFTKHNKRHK